MGGGVFIDVATITLYEFENLLSSTKFCAISVLISGNALGVFEVR